MILIASVGYQYLGDLSFGPLLVERLRDRGLRAGVQLEDLSFGPIAVVQWLQDDPARFDQAIFTGSVIRGRPPGTLSISEWHPGDADPSMIQQRIAEAVTGVINLENTLIICDHFGVLPARTTVIDLEPVEINWNQPLSRWGEVRMGEAEAWVQERLGTAPSPGRDPEGTPLETEGGEKNKGSRSDVAHHVSPLSPSLEACPGRSRRIEGGAGGGSRPR
jgi:hypothetical protein